MKELRSQFRAVIFGLTGVIVAFLVFRIAVDLISASPTNILVQFIDAVTNFLITPFKGIIVLPPGTLNVLNVDAIVSIGIYVLSAIAFTEIVTAFMQDTPEAIIQNIIDAIFKFVEFLLILRIVFELFGVLDNAQSSVFVKAIYGLTGWSQGVLFRINYGTGFVDLSAIICLVIVAVLDLLTERVVDSMFKRVTEIRQSRPTPPPKPVQIIPVPPQVNMMQPQMQPNPNPPLQQNITINVPVPHHVIQPVIPVPIRPVQPSQPKRIEVGEA